MPPRRPLQLLCALLIATLAVAPRAARGADSFYTDLLSRGSQAYSSGDYRDAERMFRIACFGFLDEPPLLLEGLVRLSLARAAAGDVEGFREAFGRISDLERRFGTYSTTTLPDSLRQLFEQELLARIPSRDLEALELRTGASRSIGADMEGLPLRQRRAELRRRATSDPDDIRWPLALAELETEAGRHREALGWIDWLTELDPRSATGACLRGWNLAETGACPTALVLLGECSATATDVRYARPLLECLAKADNWNGAAAAVAAQPANFRDDSAYSRLVNRIERKVGAIAQTSAPAASLEESPETGSEDAAVRVGLRDRVHLVTDRERQIMRTVRETLATARRKEDLASADELVAGLAAAHPGVAEVQYLAGEVAYRASRWSQAVEYFQRAGEPDASRSKLLFYLAVSLYESGDRAEASRVLSRALPGLEKTSFVRSYQTRINGSLAGSN